MLTYFVEALSSSTKNFNVNSSEYVQTVLCVLTICLSATFWNKRSKWQKTLSLMEKFPGPKKYPIFGSVISPEFSYIIFNPKRKLIDCLENFTKSYGKIFCIWLFNEPKVVIADTELAIKLYNNGSIHEKASDLVRAGKAIGGDGLLILPENIHSIRKRQWMPSFTRKRIEYSIQFFQQQAIRLCDELRKHQNTAKPFDLLPISVGCTFRTICYSAFGEDYMSKLPESVGYEHMHDLHTVSRNMTDKNFQPWNWIEFLYFHATPKGRETTRCVQRANSLTKQAVRDRQTYRKLHAKPESSEDFECFLDHMLKLLDEGVLTEWQIIQELNIFIAAGYDTSGVTICYVLYFLSLYPEHQEKIVEELRAIIPSEHWNNIRNYPITALMTKQMKYLELCIKEALRIYPITGLSARRTVKDVELPDGRIIPENVDVVVMLNQIHRDPKYFPEPERFIPERHLQPIPAFMPFTLGSRSCIGQVYAMYEMKVILAYLLMEYKWETVEKPNFKPIFQILLVPENGMYFKITKREF